jgi:hypothetical protein
VLGEALTTAQVSIPLATHLDEFAPQTVRSLADARKRTRTFRMYPEEPGVKRRSSLVPAVGLLDARL